MRRETVEISCVLYAVLLFISLLCRLYCSVIFGNKNDAHLRERPSGDGSRRCSWAKKRYNGKRVPSMGQDTLIVIVRISIRIKKDKATVIEAKDWRCKGTCEKNDGRSVASSQDASRLVGVDDQSGCAGYWEEEKSRGQPWEYIAHTQQDSQTTQRPDSHTTPSTP